MKITVDAVSKLHIAECPDAPACILMELSADACSEVRIAVAEHSRTPMPVVEMLAEDDDPDVRYAIAENANMRPHILKILAQDDNPYVASRAMKTLERLGQPETYCLLRYRVA